MIVNVQEKVINEEEHNLGNFKPLTASMSGRITEIKLIQGTLKVKAGDIVKKGDILVEPHIIDSSGNIKEVMAQAEIYAEVWLEGRSTHYDSCYKTIKTGKKVEKQDIYFLNQPIYLDKVDIDFLEYETSFKQTYLSYSLLPLVLRKTIVEETQTILEEIPFEIVRKQKVEEAKNFALSKAQNKSVINEYHTINSNNGVTIVSYVLVAIENISLQ